jgi:polar amino acid transport system permease protein
MAEMIGQIVYALPFLLNGFVLTIVVSALVIGIALPVGVVLGVGLIYGPLPVRLAIRVLSDTVRGIPVLVLLFFVYYGLPALHLNLQSFWAAVVALTLFNAAHVVEYARGAIESIPKGQTEAGMAIGLTFGRRLHYVIFPQAILRFLPPWLNGVTDAVKGSSLVSLLGVTDLMYATNQVIGRTYEAMPLYVLGAVIYFSVNYALSATSRQLERKFAYIRE